MTSSMPSHTTTVDTAVQLVVGAPLVMAHLGPRGGTLGGWNKFCRQLIDCTACEWNNASPRHARNVPNFLSRDSPAYVLHMISLLPFQTTPTLHGLSNHSQMQRFCLHDPWTTVHVNCTLPYCR